MSQPTRLLFVCLGNICRSPAAEIIFSQLVEQAGRGGVDGFGFGSCGFGVSL
jgi:protein-tyrosine phosphatase